MTIKSRDFNFNLRDQRGIGYEGADIFEVSNLWRSLLKGRVVQDGSRSQNFLTTRSVSFRYDIIVLRF